MTAARKNSARSTDGVRKKTSDGGDDALLKKIVGLLGRGAPETRAAAALVLGALKPKAPFVERALLRNYATAPATVAPYVLDALAELRTDAGLRLLSKLLGASGAARDQAALLIARFGERAFPEIRKAGPDDPLLGGAARLVAAVRTGAPESAAYAAPALMRGDGGLAKHLVRELRLRKKTFGEKSRRAWAGRFAEWLADATERRAAKEVVAAAKLLRAFPTPSAAPTLARLLSDAPPHVMRSAVAALQATTPFARDAAAVRAALDAVARNPALPDGLRGAAARAARATARPKSDRSDGS